MFLFRNLWARKLTLSTALPFLITTSVSALEEEPDPLLHSLAPFVVTGVVNPTESNQTVVPVDQLDSEALDRWIESTVGETTQWLPGLRSTSFGPGASRPIIRGFDGPRVRVLENGLGTLDVSDSSPDHGVSVDPFFAQSIEVLRGPSTLLYGSSAIGGVVNVVDNRIPRQSDLPPSSGQLRASYESAGEGLNLSGRWSLSRPGYALTLGANRHDTNAIEIPGPAESARLRALEAMEEADHEHEEEADHGHEEGHEEDEETPGLLENSFVETDSYSLGGSWFVSESLRLSGALFGYDSLYGVPGHAHAHEEEEDHEHEEEGHEEEEEAVSIDLSQRRVDLEGSLALNGPVWNSLLVRFNWADYEHTELEGTEVGTRFERQGWELRAEARHQFTARSSGVWGFQLAESDFLAEGEEAFTPPSTTRDLALFALEEWSMAKTTLQAGLRLETRDIQAETPAVGDYDGLAWSASGGVLVPLGEGWNAGLNLARSERHPTSAELFADGPHAATRQYERGDPLLGTEVSYGLDLSLRRLSGPITGQVTVFFNQFEDYINAAPTGLEADALPLFQYGAVDARFYGLEAELTWHVIHEDSRNLDLTLVYDLTRAVNETEDQWLPRIPPARLGLRGLFSQGPWRMGSDLFYSQEQNQVAPGEIPTDAFTEWSVYAEYAFRNSTVFVRGRNLLDEEIRHHTSFLKDLAPEAGRGWEVGLRFVF